MIYLRAIEDADVLRDFHAVDLFAGPGGWDLALKLLKLRVLGIELDDAAVATRRAAGLDTLHADVASIDPTLFRCVPGFIASPPCQGFSMAGHGAGRAALGVYIEALSRIMYERKSVDYAEFDDVCSDPRAHLVLEVARWIVGMEPRWVALEQVEPVLPLWVELARILRVMGYSAWAGVLSAERFGVPQTRRRAILVASLDREVGEPRATHQRYVAPRRKERQEETLFAPPEPERIVVAGEEHLKPWVSMAEALGWDPGDVYLNGTHDHRAERPATEPAPTLHFGGRLNTVTRLTVRTGENTMSSSRDPRWKVAPEGEHVDPPHRWKMRSNAQPNAAERFIDEPAPTITGGHDHQDRAWIVDTGNTQSGSRKEGRARPVTEPAPVVTSRADQLEWRSEEPDTAPYPTHDNARDQKDGRTGEPNRMRSVDEPAPTIAGESRNDSWVFERPATTMVGDARVLGPHSGGNGEAHSSNAIRVSLEEAAVLQSFPPDHPWQGNKTQTFQQVGNAYPPLMAFHTLKEVVG